MRNMRKFALTAAFTLLLVFLTAFCISGTVHSGHTGGSLAKERYYHTAREEYLQAVERFLEEKGYGSSGVTMNYVIHEDGTLEYTVTIHHRKIDKLDGEERNLLAEECKEAAFPADIFELSVVFL